MDFHESLGKLSAAYGFDVMILGQGATSQQIETAFTPSSLDGYQAVVFAYNDGVDRYFPHSLMPEFESWVKNGGGLIAINSASAFIGDWPFLTEALVQSFYGPWAIEMPKVDLHIDSEGLAEGSETRGILLGLEAPAQFIDAFYSFRQSPRGEPGVTILVTMDEKSYSTIGYPMGDDHPLVWCKRMGKGRVVHNSLGYSNRDSNVYTQKGGFLENLLYRTMRYVAGDFTGCANPADANFNPGATQSDPAACAVVAKVRNSVSGYSVSPFSLIPGRNALGVNHTHIGDFEVSLTDIRGNISDRKTGYGPQRFDLAFPSRSGVYLIQVKTRGESFTRCLVVP